MLSHFESPAPPPCPASFNLAAYVLGQADRLADKTALAIVSASGAERWQYGRLLAAVSGIARGLREAGLVPGDRLLMRLSNEVEFPLAYLGAIWAGIIPVPASSALTVPEVTRIAAELKPKAIVGAEAVSLPDPLPCPVISDADLRDMEALAPQPPEMGDPERPAYIIYTSGSSGTPRGVVHAHRAIWARRMMWDGWYGLTETDRLLHAGAFNWTYTLGTGLMDPWAIGATALIPAPGTDSRQLPLLMKRHQATIFAAAPGVYRQMLKDRATLDLPALRHGLSAGEKMAQGVREAWDAACGKPIYEALGMSECSTFISGSPAHPVPWDSAGRPQDGRRIAVLGEDDEPVERGTPGVLAVHRSDSGLMLGYLDAPEETAVRFSGDWFLTGDTVAMDEKDSITYLGRGDDMMNAGGFRVSPLEVEAALLAHPGITEVACAEVEVRAGVTVIGAFYTGPAALPEAALTAFAADRLAGYKCPRLYRYLDTLPRAGNGKLNRRAVRDLPPT